MRSILHVSFIGLFSLGMPTAAQLDTLIQNEGNVEGLSAHTTIKVNERNERNERKSYVNDKYGFAIDYPSALIFVESERQHYSESLLFSFQLLSLPLAKDLLLRDRVPGQFALQVFANPQNLSLDEWLDVQGWPFGIKAESAMNIEINGLFGLDVSSGQMLAPNRYVYLLVGSFIIRMVPIGAPSENILHSFRRMKQ